MKRLTGVTVILAGIGAVAGIFGMSEAARDPTARASVSGSSPGAIVAAVAAASSCGVGWI